MGLVKQRINCSDLIAFFNFVPKCFNTRQNMYVTNTNFFKAFNFVNHDIFISKISELNIPNQLSLWLTTYLSNWSCRVSFNCCTLHSFFLPSEVPQVSILGPLSFQCFIKGLLSSLTYPCLLYVDDDKLFTSTICLDYAVLKFSLDMFVCWWLLDKLSNILSVFPAWTTSLISDLHAWLMTRLRKCLILTSASLPTAPKSNPHWHFPIPT